MENPELMKRILFFLLLISSIAQAQQGNDYLNPIFNVKKYLPVGQPDGSTDNTVGINAAVKAWHDAGSKGKVYMPGNGTPYIVLSSYVRTNAYKPQGIILYDNLEIYGDGVGKTIINQGNSPAGLTYNPSTDTATGYWFSAFNGFNNKASNVSIHDLEYFGNNTNQVNWNSNAFSNPGWLTDTSYHQTQTGITFFRGHNNHVYNVYFHETQAEGVTFIQSYHGLVEDSHFRNCGGGGVSINGQTSYFTNVINVWVDSSYSDNIRATQTSRIAVERCKLSKSRPYLTAHTYAGIYFEDVNYSSITHCILDSNSAVGADINNISLVGVGNVIKDNQIVGNSTGSVIAVGNTAIEDNYMTGIPNGAAAHINLNGGKNFKIKGNRIDLGTLNKAITGAFGTQFGSSIITDNIVRGLGSESLFVQGDSGTSIIGGNSLRAFDSTGLPIKYVLNALNGSGLQSYFRAVALTSGANITMGMYGPVTGGNVDGVSNNNLAIIYGNATNMLLKSDGPMVFSTNGAERLRLDASGNTKISGNLGINKTPSSLIDIINNGAVPSSISVSNNVAGQYSNATLLNDGSKYISLNSYGSTLAGTVAGISNNNLANIQTNTTLLIGPTSSNSFYLVTNNVVRMTLDNAGGIIHGIGQFGITEGTNGRVGQTTLVAGTKAITITGLTASSRAIVSLVSQGGTSTTTYEYVGVCTSNTLTISAITTAGAVVTTDTGLVNYFVIN